MTHSNNAADAVEVAPCLVKFRRVSEPADSRERSAADGGTFDERFLRRQGGECPCIRAGFPVATGRCGATETARALSFAALTGVLGAAQHERDEEMSRKGGLTHRCSRRQRDLRQRPGAS